MIKRIFLKRGLLLVIALLFVFAMTATPALAAPSWQYVGSPGFSGYSNTLGSFYVYNGTPYVAYVDNAKGDKASVMEYTGGSWQYVGSRGFSKDEAWNESLYVDNGTPYVAFEDEANGGKATVMEYTGGSWQPVGSPGFSKGQAKFESLYVYNGTPYVAYKDDANGLKTSVMEYTGGSWQYVGSPGFSSSVADFESLYVYNGTPYVAYSDSTNVHGGYSGATVMKYTGGSWQPVGSPGFSNGAAYYESLYVYNGTPYVAFSDSSVATAKGGYGGFGVATVMEYTGGAWQPVGSPGFSKGQTACESLYVYNGTPYVAYKDDANGERATVMKYASGSWQPVGSPGFSSGIAKDGSLFVYNGTPYVAFSDSSVATVKGGYGGATVMEYADTTPASSTEPAIQVNINGSPLQLDVPPTIVNGRTLVPLRAIFEALGAQVQWDAASQSITATKGNIIINLTIGSTMATNKGTQVTLDVPPQIIDGRTLVPARFVSEALGAQVQWDTTNQAVDITTAGN